MKYNPELEQALEEANNARRTVSNMTVTERHVSAKNEAVEALKNLCYSLEQEIYGN